MTKKIERYLKRIRAITPNDPNDILNKFKSSYGHLIKKGLSIDGIVDMGEGNLVISISHPLIFDSRLLPNQFMGLFIRGHIDEDSLPDYFSNDNRWNPDHFERFVTENEKLIREKLSLNDSSREDLLDAICFGDFKQHIKLYKE